MVKTLFEEDYSWMQRLGTETFVFVAMKYSFLFVPSSFILLLHQEKVHFRELQKLKVLVERKSSCEYNLQP